jgi:hypothetical protein
MTHHALHAVHAHTCASETTQRASHRPRRTARSPRARRGNPRWPATLAPQLPRVSLGRQLSRGSHAQVTIAWPLLQLPPLYPGCHYLVRSPDVQVTMGVGSLQNRTPGRRLSSSLWLFSQAETAMKGLYSVHRTGCTTQLLAKKSDTVVSYWVTAQLPWTIKRQLYLS